MLAGELERRGIPTAQITSITGVALMAGSNRVVPGLSIVCPVGKAGLNAAAEKSLRRTVVEKAVEALTTEIKGQKVFTTN